MNRHTIILAAVLGLVACSEPSSSESVAAKPTLTVRAVTPRADSWPGTVAASGSIAPWQEASIGSEIGGVRLDEVHVNVGDRVEKGQLLARFSEESLQADLARLDAQVKEAQATLDKARLDAEGAERLETSGGISKQQARGIRTQAVIAEAQLASAKAARDAQVKEAQATLDKARLDAEGAERLETSGGISKQQARGIRTQAVIAEAQLASAKAARDAQALRLRYARVVAPDAGIISARSATVGAVVTPGVELFRLIRGGRLEWRAEVRADALGQLKKGMPASIRLPQGEVVTGKVRQLAPTVSSETLSGVVYVDLPSGTGLAAGLFVSGEFELAATDVLVVPASAVVLRSGNRYVMQLSADNRVRETKVETGRRRGNDVEILAGVDAGARLALSGGAFLNDGDLVTVAQ